MSKLNNPLWPARTPCPVDLLFSAVIGQIKSLSEEQLCTRLIEQFQKMPTESQILLEGYYRTYHFWGTLNAAKNDFGILKNRAKELAMHSDDFFWLYQRLADYRSRFILYGFLNNWFSLDTYTLDIVQERLYPDYFDMDLLQCGAEEIFVDLGAYTGDTVLGYFSSYGANFKRIYCYEISPDTMEILRKNLREYSNILFRQKGASDQKETLYMSAHSTDTSANALSENGTFKIETVAIDDDILEPVTFIKMDIEGFEQRALSGCARHIKYDHPKLAISLYHNNEDIWKIPRMIEEICPGYTFYLRYHGENLSPTELSLLAVYEA